MYFIVNNISFLTTGVKLTARPQCKQSLTKFDKKEDTYCRATTL
jgi:hypothetical protein